MMYLKRTAAAILGGAVLFTGAAFAANLPTADTTAAADSAVSDSVTAQQAPEVLAERNLYYGTIEEIVRDEQTGAVTSLVMQSDSQGAYVFHLDEATLLFDNGTGSRTMEDQLTVGQGVYVFHSPIMTMSLPPQSYAEAVVVNVAADAGSAMLHTVEEVQANEDGSVTVTTDRGSLHLTITKDAQYGDYNGRQIMGADDLRIGTRLFAWYGAVAESYPAQAVTDHVVVVPAKEMEGLAITVDGEQLAGVTARMENGTLMVPASAVAKELGLTATYANTAEGEKVTLQDGKNQMVMDIGSDTYHVAQDEVLSYGAPAVIEEGTTWMPAQALADLVGADLSLADGSAAFTTAE
ncbi:MAG TPA: copper amine oxidase N-terminal domain-containing protein [Candidatus Butyricicoccus avicola]|nr:copper amine oxidase N-terminal domain-containing protein [Candidatus Butyricicoccus avicola]